MNRRYLMAASLSVLVAVFATPALAGKGGNNPHGSGTAAAASCVVVADGVVRGSGLPTDEVVNFMLTDASGTTGWVLGFTWDGTFSVRVPAAVGPTTYEFVSRTSGPGGSRYTVFAAC